MSHDDERVGANVTRQTHIAHDGRHAFYAGGQTYAERVGANGQAHDGRASTPGGRPTPAPAGRRSWRWSPRRCSTG